MKTITTNELELAMKKETPVLIDVREIFEYNSGHVPGAINIPLSELEQRYEEIPNNSYIICQSGARSMQACHYLQLNGLDVINISGGTSSWSGGLEY